MRLALFKEIDTTVPLKKIKKLFNEIYDVDRPGTVNIVFTDDKHMRRINNQFRKLDKTTDVLSFNIENNPIEDKDVFGEIYISVAVAQKQAIDYGATLKEEYLRLVCHGFLHLLGYDHIKKKDAVKMETAEKHYLGMLVK